MKRKSIEPDLYAELGLDRSATPDAIKRAYRAKAKSAHPDAGGSADDFRRIALAHRILSAPDKRERYDETGAIDDAADNSAIDAANIIAQLLEEMVTQDSCSTAVDAVAAMRSILKIKMAEIEPQLRALRSQAEHLEKFAGRFHGKRGKGNMLRTIVQRRVAAMRANIVAGEKAILDLKAAAAILADYSFEVDPPAAREQAHSFTINFFGVGPGTTTA